MKKMQKVLALVLSLVLVLSLTTACKKETKKDPAATSTPGTETSAPETEAPANTDPVTIKVVSQMGGTDPKTEMFNTLIDEFKTQYPYITVENDSAVADEVWKAKIATDFATGNEPDVIQYFTDANATDVLASDPFVTVEEIKAVYPDYAKDVKADAIAAAKNPDGVERAVPTTGFWEGMFCNKDLFDKAGAEIPTDWASLKTAVEKLNAAGITPIAVSLNEIPHYWIEFLMMMMAGVDEFNQVPQTAPESWVKGLELFKELRDMGAFPDATDTLSNDEAGNLFKEKKAAMQVDGNWYLSGIPDTENTVVAPFPTVEGGKGEYGDAIAGLSVGFYITKKAWNDPAKRDAAVKFVMANTSKEQVVKYWGGVGYCSVEAEAPADMTPLAISGVDYSNSTKKVVAPTDARLGGEAYNVLVGNIVGISTGDVKAEDVINEALEIANR